MNFFSQVYIDPTPPYKQGVTQGQFLKQNTAGLNFKFSFSLIGCLTKAKEPNLSYLLTAGAKEEKMDSNISQVQSKMQTVSPRIWTLSSQFISNNNNHFAKSTSNFVHK